MYNIILHILVTEPDFINPSEVTSIFPPECVTLDFGSHIRSYPIRLGTNFYSVLFQQFETHNVFWFGEFVKQQHKAWISPLPKLTTREKNRETFWTRVFSLTRSFPFNSVRENSLHYWKNERIVASTFYTSTQPQTQKLGLICHWEMCYSIYSNQPDEYSVFYILFCHF